MDKKISRKERRKNKLKEKLLGPNDIKYGGPLSYRYLRIIAWIAFACGQLALICSICQKVLKSDLLPGSIYGIIDVFSLLAIPLFIIASFSLTLSGRKGYKKLLLSYGVAYLGVALGIILFFARYINGLLLKMGIPIDFVVIVDNVLEKRADFNVFADLFAFALFYYFLNYTPEKHFKDKKLLIFRWFSLFPIIFIIGSYVLKVLFGLHNLQLPYFVYPLLATKPPLVFLVFVIVTLWLKNRERFFLKIGGTKEEYQQYLQSNKGSLSFSGHLSVIILVVGIIDFLVTLGVFVSYTVAGGTAFTFEELSSILQLGESGSLILSIPLVLLFSYRKKHKNTLIDSFLPFCGIALAVLVYLECIYQLLLELLT